MKEEGMIVLPLSARLHAVTFILEVMMSYSTNQRPSIYRRMGLLVGDE